MPETLTVAEMCDIATNSHADADALMERFGLAPHATSFVAELSTGMRRILDLAMATVGDPDVLLLDEPASGLAVAEVELLAELLTQWRDDTGGSILLVEHDPPLVRRVADEVIVLDAGRVLMRGAPAEILDAAPVRPTRFHDPTTDTFRAALGRVAEDAAPAAPPVRRVVSTWSLLRLGLREFSAGMASVLILGVLNRVMKVELGISLLAVAVILASYNLAAPIALAIGHRSDTHPIRGRRRTPYIIGGAIVTGLTVAAAPHVAGRLAHGLNAGSVLLAIALFVVMGIGMYGSGTVFFALIADLAPPPERGHAASIVYFELMAGILAGVALTTAVVDNQAGGLTTLFALAGLLIVALTTIAVWGQEDRVDPDAVARPEDAVPFRVAIGSIAKMSQARLFFGFMGATTLFLFLQQAVLEPYGGDVLGLDVRQTSSFNAVMTIGILIGMVWAGKNKAQQLGHKRVAMWGLLLSVVGFAWLALAANAGSQPPSWLSIFVIGLASGTFNVSVLALMMSMADARRTALFMGAWTVAHSLADGLATAGGGVIHDLASRVVSRDATAYALVFAVEAIGMLACLPMLRAIDPERFAAEAAAYEPPRPEQAGGGDRPVGAERELVRT
jgi:BCD family chlorophyll transporter-like MFS transporter